MKNRNLLDLPPVIGYIDQANGYYVCLDCAPQAIASGASLQEAACRGQKCAGCGRSVFSVAKKHSLSKEEKRKGA